MTNRSNPLPAWRLGAVDEGRRRTIKRLTAYFTAGALTSSGVLAQTAGSCVLTPEVGEGPFYFDPELLRADITDGQPGAPLELSMQVVREGDCATLADARVDVWQCDAYGLYSGYGRQRGSGTVSPSTVVEEDFLRGTQFTDENGSARFRTIYPSWYRGRTPHIHFKVFVGGNEMVASQIFFPEEINEQVFERWDPYREHREQRDTFNSNDTFLSGRVGGVFCEIEERSDDYLGTLVVAVRSA